MLFFLLADDILQCIRGQSWHYKPMSQSSPAQHLTGATLSNVLLCWLSLNQRSALSTRQSQPGVPSQAVSFKELTHLLSKAFNVLKDLRVFKSETLRECLWSDGQSAAPVPPEISHFLDELHGSRGHSTQSSRLTGMSCAGSSAILRHIPSRGRNNTGVSFIALSEYFFFFTPKPFFLAMFVPLNLCRFLFQASEPISWISLHASVLLHHKNFSNLLGVPVSLFFFFFFLLLCSS